MSWLLRIVQGVQVWECPCSDYRVVAGRRARRGDMVDLALGQHLKECVVAQADLILRTDAVDPGATSE